MNGKRKQIQAAEVSELHTAIYSAFEGQIFDADRIASAIDGFIRHQDEDPEMAVMIVFGDCPGRCVIISNDVGHSCKVREAETLTTSHCTEDGNDAADITFFAYDASIVGKERGYADLRSAFFERYGPKKEIPLCGVTFYRFNHGSKMEEIFFCCEGLTEFIDISFHDDMVEIWFDDISNERIQIYSLDELIDHINKRKVV